ncbi:MAG: hypothetical protein ACN6O0_04680 [Achromobacter spanius]
MRTILNIFQGAKKTAISKRRRRFFLHAVSGATPNKRKKAGVTRRPF